MPCWDVIVMSVDVVSTLESIKLPAVGENQSVLLAKVASWQRRMTEDYQTE